MAVLSGPSIATADDPANAVHYYLALGDSLAGGTQPNGDTGPDGMFLHGYANQLLAALQANDPTLQLQNLSCGGESTSSMISGEEVHFVGNHSRSFCGYRSWHGHLAHGSQLDDAVAFLHAHSQFVSLITIDIGAEVGSCIYALDQACLDDGLATIELNLPVILSTLQQAAPGVPIVGMNYYDPFLVFWFSDPTAAQTTEQMVVQLNAVLGSIYGAAGIPVADVQTAFSTTDWTLVNGIPLNVERICEWTWMCDPTYGPDIHANTAGYGVIAQAFEQVLP
jgi:lysophospholipase L1-like esterase